MVNQPFVVGLCVYLFFSLKEVQVFVDDDKTFPEKVMISPAWAGWRETERRILSGKM